MSLKTKEDTDEFNKLYNLLNTLAANNKDPDKVISIDTNDLLSNKSIEDVMKKEVPKKTIVIDDSILDNTHESSMKKENTESIKNSASEKSEIKKPMISSTKTSTSKKSLIKKETIDSKNSESINEVNQMIHPSKKKEESLEHSSNLSLIIGIDINSNKKIHSQKEIKLSIPQDKIKTKMKVNIGIDLDSELSDVETEEQVIVDSTHETCKACQKTFAKGRYLLDHLKRNPMCNQWVKTRDTKKNNYIPKMGIRSLVEEYVNIIITGENEHQCRYCKNSFSNGSGHYRHFTYSMPCNRMAIADFLDGINDFVKT